MPILTSEETIHFVDRIPEPTMYEMTVTDKTSSEAGMSCLLPWSTLRSSCQLVPWPWGLGGSRLPAILTQPILCTFPKQVLMCLIEETESLSVSRHIIIGQTGCSVFPWYVIHICYLKNLDFCIQMWRATEFWLTWQVSNFSKPALGFFCEEGILLWK